MTSAEYGAEVGGTFGPVNQSQVWGAADAHGLHPEGEGVFQGRIKLSEGVEMEVNEEVCKALLYSEEAIEAICNRAQKVVDVANGMAITEDARYLYVLQKGEGHSRPQCLVMPDNFKAVVDDAAHSTLMAAAAAVGSEEINWGWDNVFGKYLINDEEPGSTAQPGEGEGAAAEGAEGAEAAGGAAGAGEAAAAVVAL
jgi:hypothetical protein